MGSERRGLAARLASRVSPVPSCPAASCRPGVHRSPCARQRSRRRPRRAGIRRGPRGRTGLHHLPPVVGQGPATEHRIIPGCDRCLAGRDARFLRCHRRRTQVPRSATPSRSPSPSHDGRRPQSPGNHAKRQAGSPFRRATSKENCPVGCSRRQGNSGYTEIDPASDPGQQ
jgi:hypothetical protein